jgi:hypothetical protein
MSCPFKVLFEGSALVTNISIGFKNAEGKPLSASDERQPEGQTRDHPAEDDPVGFSKTAELQSTPEENPAAEATEQCSSGNLRPEASSPPVEDQQGLRQGAEAAELVDGTAAVQDSVAAESRISEEPPVSSSSAGAAASSVRRDLEMIGIAFPELNSSSSVEKTSEEKAPEGVSPLENVSQTLGEISNGGNGSDPLPENAEEKEGPSEDPIGEPAPAEGTDSTVVPWIESFRSSIDAFYRHHPDPFQQWFRGRQEEKEFADDSHALVTILLHARFDQMTPSAKALGNTQRAYPVMTRPSVALEEIPALEGTLRFPDDGWKMLFYKAIPRLREVTQHILARRGWSVADLEQLLQVIPHMGQRTSRQATKWIRALMAETVQIDLSQARVLIGEPLYRVAARLGVVDPQSDRCGSSNSRGDIKIQSFAKAAFPEDILRIEEPLEWVGNPSEADGHCVALHPRCEGCLFDGFCPKLHDHGDPCEKGMGKTR